ncbi:MAG TPA: NADH-quinone oxidoreductase subunit H [Elusimicrobiales bacterium]|nr:NADH-quinone oxidoreductase subunit H [Elusimicrobiales bacterium]HPO94397.1 NADH-quinone oxidoreductase subunit H [Elusimicrobiales bacterium]
MDTIMPLLYIAVFPGFVFLGAYATLIQWIDRKVTAVMQNRVGPPIYQPIADFIKLISKEVVIPDNADEILFKSIPYIALASIITTIFMIPVWGTPMVSFEGDIVVIVYLLTIPTVTFFLAGWSSTSPYSTIGSMRVMTQLFGYEVPLFLSFAGCAIIAQSWSVYKISEYFTQNPLMILVNIPGFIVALLASQGKLERVPFDTPHAKNEIVGGQFTEYSGRLLGIFLLAIDIEMVVLAALINAVFLGGLHNISGFFGFAIFIIKTLVVCLILTLFKVLMARVRVDQMVKFSWKYLVPVAVIQILIDLYIRLKF